MRESATRLGAAIATLRHLAGDLLAPMPTGWGWPRLPPPCAGKPPPAPALPWSARHGAWTTWPIDFEADLNLTAACSRKGWPTPAATAAAPRLWCRWPLASAADPAHRRRRLELDPEVRLPEARAQKRMGLWSMGERLRLLGGRLTIRSRPGHGVRNYGRGTGRQGWG